jgi:hypothetical protein
MAVASAGDFDGDGDWDLALGAPDGNKVNDAVTGFIHLQDSSNIVVPAFFSHWSAAWTAAAGGDLVRLSFAFALPSADFPQVELFRQIRDGRGAVLEETPVWSGAPRSSQDEGPGVLSVSGTGFLFFDRLGASPDARAASLTYSLKAVTNEGFSFSLNALAGPGELAAHLDFGRLLALAPAWPNPANPAVTIRFRAAPAENVVVRIMDLRGSLVTELFAGPGTGYWQNVVWNGRTARGAAAASGLYLIRLENGLEALNQRVVLAR